MILEAFMIKLEAMWKSILLLVRKTLKVSHFLARFVDV